MADNAAAKDEVPLNDLGSKDEKDIKTESTELPAEPEETPMSPEGTDENAPLISPRLSISEPDTPNLKREGSSNLEPIVEAHGDEVPVVDKTSDVETPEQKKTFKRYMESIASDRKQIKVVLHEIVRKNFPGKLRLTCKYMKKQGMSLIDDDMLGDKSKESVLCLAVILGHSECTEILCEYGKQKLVTLEYQSKPHKGTTALHLAILKQNLQAIVCMMSQLDAETKHSFLHIRATGTHFEQRYNCACLPLCLAAGVGNISIFNSLVKYGADLWLGDDETGNTVLHSLAAIAIHNPEMAVNTMKKIIDSEEVHAWLANKKTDEALKDKVSGLSIKSALLKAENKDGHTPFMYASCLGAVEFASAILEIEGLYKYPQWEVGPSSYVLYEMSEIDSSIDDSSFRDPPNPIKRDSTERAKALEIFAFVLRDEKLDYGKIPAIKHAMLNKWDAYRGWFIGWMVLHFLIMLIFTLSAQFYVRSVDDPKNLTETIDNMTHTKSILSTIVESPKNRAVLSFEIIVFIAAIAYFGLEMYDIITLLRRKLWKTRGFERAKRMSIPVYLTLQFDIFRALLFTFSFSVILIFILKFVRSPWQDFAYAVAALTGWSFMLFFTRAFQNIGIFTVMLQRMITRELVYFAVVFIVIMAGFSTATFCLFQETLTDPPGEVATMAKTFFAYFRLVVGLEDFAISDEARLPWMMKCIFILFVLLANILLLNMLIAAMNNTYTQLDSLKEAMWLKMRIKAVLLLERRLIKKLRPKSNFKRYGRDRQWFLASEEVKSWHPLAGGTEVVL